MLQRNMNRDVDDNTNRNTNETRAGLLLVGAAPPPSGGIAVHMDDLARGARALGARVRIADVPPGVSRSSASASRLIAQLVAARARGDLMHLHTNGHNDGSWRLIRLVGGVGGASALLTIHSGLAPSYIAAHAESSRDLCRAFARVVCVSEAIATALQNTGVERSRLVVAPAFSSALLPPALAPAGLAAIRRRHAALVAATLGRGVEYGGAVLLDAFYLLRRNMPDAGLLLYGPGARDPMLDGQIRARDLGRAIYRVGDLARAEALGAIAAADLFVRPTLADGDSVSVREALALGVRALASDAAPRPPGVRLFAAGNAVALAAAMRASLDEPRPAPTPCDGTAPVFAIYRAAGVVEEPLAGPHESTLLTVAPLRRDAQTGATTAAEGR